MDNKFIAVAAIRHKGSLVGARIVSYDGKIIHTLTNEQIVNLIGLGVSVRNLQVKDGTIVWSQGSDGRYPTIHTDRPDQPENRDSIVVLGKYKDPITKELMFTIANYTGDIISIEEQRLIKYGKKYNIGNCKVVTKGGNEFISSISGHIDDIDTKVKILRTSKKLTVILPPANIKSLVIPDTVGTSIAEIETRPEGRAKFIKNILIEGDWSILSKGQFRQFTELEQLLIKGTVGESGLSEGEVLRYNRKLKEVHFRNLAKYSRMSRMFSGVHNLEAVTLGGYYKEIEVGMFRDCTKLDIQKVLIPGIEKIDRQAFQRCQGTTRVVLPESLVELDKTAFEGCRNIKELVITNDTTWIGSLKADDEKLLNKSYGATLYCPYDYPDTILKREVAPHVRIVRSKPTDEQLEMERRRLKAQILGEKVVDVVQRKDEVAAFFTVITDEVWDREFVKVLKDRVESGYLKRRPSRHIYINSGASWLPLDLQWVFGEVVFKGETYVVLHDVDKENGDMTVLLKNRSILRERAIQGMIDMTILGIRIPEQQLRGRYKDVKNIYEEGDKLIVECERTGDIEVSVARM